MPQRITQRSSLSLNADLEAIGGVGSVAGADFKLASGVPRMIAAALGEEAAQGADRLGVGLEGRRRDVGRPHVARERGRAGEEIAGYA
jgi:hypothetical protein